MPSGVQLKGITDAIQRGARDVLTGNAPDEEGEWVEPGTLRCGCSSCLSELQPDRHGRAADISGDTFK